jgi:hypothetical protein
VVSSTITGNAAFIGSGISDGWGSNDRLAGVTLDGQLAYAGITEAANTIFTGGCLLTTDGPGVVSRGHNLASDFSCGLFAEGDLQGFDPQLGPLQDNGGPTETMALLSGSPALDAGGDEPVSLPGWSWESGDFTGACPATDQRGYSRPQGTHCEIGAYEVAVAALPSGSYAAKVLDLSPVAYWRLGEADGPDAIDASGFENTGTYGGGVTLAVPGAIAADADTAVTFDGVDGHVTVPPSVHLFSFPGRLSVELWAKGGPQAPDRYLISHNDAGDTQGFGITTGPTGTVRFFVDLWGRQLTHDIPFEWDCRWHHVVGVYDGSTVRMYVTAWSGRTHTFASETRARRKASISGASPAAAPPSRGRSTRWRSTGRRSPPRRSRPTRRSVRRRTAAVSASPPRSRSSSFRPETLTTMTLSGPAAMRGSMPRSPAR